MEKNRRKAIKKWIKKREKINKRKNSKFSYKKIIFPMVYSLFFAFFVLVFFEKIQKIGEVKSESVESVQTQLVTQEQIVISQQEGEEIKNEIQFEVTPQVETESVPEENVLEEKLIAKHTISNSTSSTDRNINMAVAASTINGETNGFILEPGEEFHWIDIVGATTEEKGYKMAGVIVNKRHSYGLGGGVCQVSSTINSAIIKTGIDTHAQKHSLKSSYIIPENGDKEATVSFDSGIDFWFENTLKYPIRIKVKTEDGSVTVKVFKRKYTQKKVE